VHYYLVKLIKEGKKMAKFRKGDWIIGSRPNPNTGDRSFLDTPILVLHVAPHHYVVKGRFGNHCLAFSEFDDQRFAKATKKTVELMTIKS
jgi:hypothetical protein